MSVEETLGARHYAGALAFDIVETGAERAVARMEVGAEMLNPFGTVHAGALVWLADVTATLCAIGDAEVGDDGRGFPLAVDLHTVLTGNVRQGVVTATAEPVKRGGSLVVIRTTVTDAADRMLIELTSTHVRAR